MFSDLMNVEEYCFGRQNLLFITFLRLAFSGYYFYMFFLFSSKFSYLFVSFYCFYFTRTKKIITGRLHWVLTEEAPRLTTMDDNNTLTVFAGFYTRSLLPLPALLTV